jgi:hypothetical protein
MNKMKKRLDGHAMAILTCQEDIAGLKSAISSARRSLGETSTATQNGLAQLEWKFSRLVSHLGLIGEAVWNKDRKDYDYIFHRAGEK